MKMTKDEIYDLALTKWPSRDVAVIEFTEPTRCVLGYWVPMGVISENEMILAAKDAEGRTVKGVRVVWEGESWEDVLDAMGWSSSKTTPRSESLARKV